MTIEQELRVTAFRQAFDIVASDKVFCENTSYDDAVLLAMQIADEYLLPFYLDKFEGEIYAEEATLSGQSYSGTE